MARRTKVVGFSAPPALVKEVARVARDERRTKSELFREMFRVYSRFRQQRDREEERWTKNLIRQAQQEERLRPMNAEQTRKEDQELLRYGARQAKKLGVKAKDVNRLVHAYRVRRQA